MSMNFVIYLSMLHIFLAKKRFVHNLALANRRCSLEKFFLKKIAKCLLEAPVLEYAFVEFVVLCPTTFSK